MEVSKTTLTRESTKVPSTDCKVIIKIKHDSNPESPRMWANLGTMVFWHSRYELGDKHNITNVEFKEMLKDKNVIARAVYMYDHSGIALSTEPYNDQWDSGFLGWIYTTKDKIREWFGIKRVTQSYIYEAMIVLKHELAIYNQFIEGDVWGFEMWSCCPCCGKPEEIIDSCWGFYGSDPKTNGMLDHIPQEYQDLVGEPEYDG